MAPSRKRRRLANSEATPKTETDTIDEPPVKKQQQRRSVFVRSLAPTTTTENLVAHFSQSFPIKHATAVVDPSTKQCRGYGFITFADAEDAQRALQEFNDTQLEGRKIKLEIAEPRHREVDDTLPTEIAGEKKARNSTVGPAAEAKAKREQERKEAMKPPKLIVRNLPWSIKKPEELAVLFRSYGKIKHVTIPSKKPGLMAGFGFVVLRGRKNAEKALREVNGKEIDGRTLAVDWAVEKDVWEEANQRDEAVNSTGNDPADALENGNAQDAVSDEDDGGLEDEAQEDSEHGESDEEDGFMSEGEASEQDESTGKKEQPAQDFSSTLFIRNIPFQTTDESLLDHFSQFGRLRYARIVLDHNTERPKGTGFVCFFNAADAQQCLRSAPAAAQASKASKSAPSVLQSELDDPSGQYTLEGRVLQLSKAVDRTEAARLNEEGIDRRGERDKDKRRLYLLSEGTISTKSALYQRLSPTEIAMREASLKQRKLLIKSNPSLHLSLTRLSVRNIPRTIGSKELKQLAREAVVGFAKDVKESKRERLSKEELARGGAEMAEAEKLRKQRGVGVVKQAKVVFEGREGGKVAEGTGAGRSRGYGFIEYHSHRYALMGLRWLNGHAIEYQVKEEEGTKAGSREELKDRKKRPIVEFAIENAQVVKRRAERENKSRQKPQANAQSAANKGADGVFEAASTGKKVSKANQSANRQRGAAAEASSADDAEKASALEKQAQRQRIIGKKRAVRRERRKASKA